MHGDKGNLEPDVNELYFRDCNRMVKNDKVIWGSCMVSTGDADAMVTGNTRRYSQSLEKINRIFPCSFSETSIHHNIKI